MDGRLRTAPLVLGASMLLLAACGAAQDVSTRGSPTTTAPPHAGDSSRSSDAGCGGGKQGDGGDGHRPSSDAPEAVRRAMASVRQAAERCDFERLAAIALEHGRFTASFATDFRDAATLARYWRAAEARGHVDVTGLLVRLLAMRPVPQQATSPAGERESLWVVPASHARPEDGAARADLQDRFGERAVTGWFHDGEYLGPRAGFAASGAWRFFIPGGD